jgi:hypothetical protein
LCGTIWTGHHQRATDKATALSEGYAPAMLPVMTGLLWLMPDSGYFLQQGRTLLIWLWLPALLAAFGSARGWRWPAQFPLYAAWLYCVARSGRVGTDGIDVAVILACALLAWALGRRRWPEVLRLSPPAAALLVFLWVLPATAGVLLHESDTLLRFAWWAFTWASLYAAGQTVSPPVPGSAQKQRDLVATLTIIGPLGLFLFKRSAAGASLPVGIELAVYFTALAVVAACYLRPATSAAQPSA